MKKFLAIAGLALAGCAPAVATEISPEPVTITVTEDSREWDCATMGNRVCGAEGHEAIIAEALSHFEGMALPGLRFEFPEACAEDAKGWHTRNDDGTSTIKVCDVTLHTLVHEIAHAWEVTNLSDADRAELMDRWELDFWADYDKDVWGAQGAERLAIAFSYTTIGEAPPFFGGDRALSEWQDVVEIVG